MEVMIQTHQELLGYFTHQAKYGRKKVTDLSVYVPSSVKKSCQLSVNQGKIIVNGTVYRLTFKNEGGGVWKATLGSL